MTVQVQPQKIDVQMRSNLKQGTLWEGEPKRSKAEIRKARGNVSPPVYKDSKPRVASSVYEEQLEEGGFVAHSKNRLAGKDRLKRNGNSSRSKGRFRMIAQADPAHEEFDAT